jgi:tetratricopeptide (TPR) repeat protein
MAIDPDLKAQVEDYKKIHYAILEAERQELKQRLRQTAAQNKTSENPKKTGLLRKLRPYLIPMAAASMICVALLSKDFLFSNKINGSALYDNYYNNYPNTLQPIIRSSDDPNTTIKAFIAYEAGDYKKAAQLFEAILDQKTDPNLKFYYSISLINLGKEDKALNLFNELKRDSTLYTPQTYWYASLLELKNGNIQRTQELIDSLQVIDPEFKTKEIIELKKQLE